MTRAPPVTYGGGVVAGAAIDGGVTGVVVRRAVKLGFVPAVVLLAAAGVAATVALGLVGGAGAPPGPGASPTVFRPEDPAAPRFPMVTRTAAALAGGLADLYVPRPDSAGRARERFPLVLLLTDPRVDPSQYEQFAHELGSYGLAVLVTGRPSDDVVRETRAWAATVEADADTYLHGLVAGEVSALVVHDGARPAPSTARAVRAVVAVMPSAAVPHGSAPTLLLCGAPDPTGGCAPTGPEVSRVTVAGGVPLSVTDQGKRTPRTFGDVPAHRLRTIVGLAQPAGLWLLAHHGDAAAAGEVPRFVDPG